MDESRIVVDSANLLPPAGCEVTFLEGGTGTKFTAVFFPHPTLWLTSSLTFQVAVPMSYPESPPLVSCDNPTDLGSALKSVEKYIHADGNVVLPILASEGNTTQGWHSHYTLSDVLHAIALLFRGEIGPACSFPDLVAPMIAFLFRCCPCPHTQMPASPTCYQWSQCRLPRQSCCDTLGMSRQQAVA